ncbi:hypothetical protein DL767_003745 [Monosporascus sp. MG133]|nr:hypothetical protein DL767_003745 [Monosporascus sp. MG133]
MSTPDDAPASLSAYRIKGIHSALAEYKRAFTDFINSQSNFRDGCTTSEKVFRELVDAHYRPIKRSVVLFAERQALGADSDDREFKKVLQKALQEHVNHLEDVVNVIDRQADINWGSGEQASANLMWLRQLQAQTVDKAATPNKKLGRLLKRLGNWLGHQDQALFSKIKTAERKRDASSMGNDSSGRSESLKRQKTDNLQPGDWYGDHKDRLAINVLVVELINQFNTVWKEREEELLAGKDATNVNNLTANMETVLAALGKPDTIVPGQSGGRHLNYSFLLEGNNYDDHVGYGGYIGFNNIKEMLGGQLSPEEMAPEPKESELEKKGHPKGGLRGGAKGDARRPGFEISEVERELAVLRSAAEFPRGSRDEIRALDGAEGIDGLREVLRNRTTPIMLTGNDPATDNSPLREKLRGLFRRTVVPQDFSDIEGTHDPSKLELLRDDNNAIIEKLRKELQTWIDNSTVRDRNVRDRRWSSDGRQFRTELSPRPDEQVYTAFQLWLRLTTQLAVVYRMCDLQLADAADALRAEQDLLRGLQLHEQVWNIWDMVHRNKDLTRRARIETMETSEQRSLRRMELRQLFERDIENFQKVIDGKKPAEKPGQSTRKQPQPPPRRTEATSRRARPTSKRTKPTSKPMPTTKPQADTSTLQADTSTFQADTSTSQAVRPSTPPLSQSAQLSEYLNLVVQMRNKYADARERCIRNRETLDGGDPATHPQWRRLNIDIAGLNSLIWSLNDEISAIQSGSYNPYTDELEKRSYPLAPPEVRYQYVIPEPEPKPLPLGIATLAPGPMPGEHPTPGLPKVLVGAPPTFGTDPPPEKIPNPPLFRSKDHSDLYGDDWLGDGDDGFRKGLTPPKPRAPKPPVSKPPVSKPPTPKPPVLKPPTPKPPVLKPLVPKPPAYNPFSPPETSKQVPETPKQLQRYEISLPKTPPMRTPPFSTTDIPTNIPSFPSFPTVPPGLLNRRTSGRNRTRNTYDLFTTKRKKNTGIPPITKPSTNTVAPTTQNTPVRPTTKASNTNRLKKPAPSTDHFPKPIRNQLSRPTIYSTTKPVTPEPTPEDESRGSEGGGSGVHTGDGGEPGDRDLISETSDGAGDVGRASHLGAGREATARSPPFDGAGLIVLADVPAGQEPDVQAAIPGLDGWPYLKSMFLRLALAAHARKVREGEFSVLPPSPGDPTKREPAGGGGGDGENYVAYRRPAPGTRGAEKEEAYKGLFDATFPEGARIISTPGLGFYCAIFAMVESFMAQFAHLSPQPTAEALIQTSRAHPRLAAVGLQLGNLGGHGGERNFLMDHAAAILEAWAEGEGLTVTLGIEFSSPDSGTRPVYWVSDFDCPFVLWIHHNNFNHYSGLRDATVPESAELKALQQTFYSIHQVRGLKTPPLKKPGNG